MPSLDKIKEEYIYERVFEYENLSEKKLALKEFEDCSFIKCNFNRTQFKSCKFLNCKFTNCNLSQTKINGSSFVGVIFNESDIIGVNWTEALWKINLLNPLEFIKCALNYSTFIGLNLQRIRIIECFAKNVDFRDADLRQSDFTLTDLMGSFFMNTNLEKANFTEAKNYTIDISLNKLGKAKFSLPEAVSLLRSLDIELV